MQFCHLIHILNTVFLDGEASIKKTCCEELKKLAWIRVPLQTTAQCTGG